MGVPVALPLRAGRPAPPLTSQGLVHAGSGLRGTHRTSTGCESSAPEMPLRESHGWARKVRCHPSEEARREGFPRSGNSLEHLLYVHSFTPSFIPSFVFLVSSHSVSSGGIVRPSASAARLKCPL